MTAIPATDPRWIAAQKAVEAMYAFWKTQPQKGAVQWIECSDGKLLVFTRAEYKTAIKRAIAEGLTPDEVFELLPPDQEGDE